MHGSILILAKKKAAGPEGYFDPMAEPGAVGQSAFELSNGGEGEGEEPEEDDMMESESEDADADETAMVHGNLYSLAEKAQSLCDMVSDGRELPEWVREKIAVADAYIDSVHDYLSYNPRAGAPMMEHMGSAPAKAKRPFPGFGPKKEMKY
jgi:hypothetical protein